MRGISGVSDPDVEFCLTATSGGSGQRDCQLEMDYTVLDGSDFISGSPISNQARSRGIAVNQDAPTPDCRRQGILEVTAVASAAQVGEKSPEDANAVRPMVGCPKNFIHCLERLSGGLRARFKFSI